MGVERIEEVVSMPENDSEVMKRFLAQPAEHGFNDDVSPVHESTPILRIGWRARLRRFLFEKEASHYSSIAPRRADGTRTKIFFFNGNGMGR